MPQRRIRVIFYSPFLTIQLGTANSFRTYATQRTHEVRGIRSTRNKNASANSSDGIYAKLSSSFQKIFLEKNSTIYSVLETHKHQPELQKSILNAYQEGCSVNPNTPRFHPLRWSLLLLIIGCSYKLYITFKSSFKSFSPGQMMNKLTAMHQWKVAENVDVKFSDVKGCDEAKNELANIVSFLKDPEKFDRIGAKLPKGVLLVGPPGVGKTLLARAVAGEANVTFIHASGSEFDEILVGVGASKLRNLFKLARSHSPCIIFIDEIDSVGGKRTSSSLHPYANQTVNQLLTEMDGFLPSEGIIILGATNQKQNLDKALLRPGRFDTEVTISPPRLEERIPLIHYYLSKVLHDDTIDVRAIAAGTTGFTGADIMNLVNQAAIHASLSGRDKVCMQDLWDARDKTVQGAVRKRIPDAETNLITAYHEAGHALVSLFTEQTMPLHMVTILPRNESLGHTSFLEEKDMYGQSFAQLKAYLDVCFGGRVAEEITFGDEKVSTGASGDFKMASKTAHAMVKIYGMSAFGPRFLDEEMVISEARKKLIDEEINRLLKESHNRAKKLLSDHSKDLKTLAEALLKYETLDKEDVLTVLKGGTPKVALNLMKINAHAMEKI